MEVSFTWSLTAPTPCCVHLWALNTLTFNILKCIHWNSLKFCTNFAHHTVTIPSILSGKIFLSENVIHGGMKRSRSSYFKNLCIGVNWSLVPGCSMWLASSWWKLMPIFAKAKMLFFRVWQSQPSLSQKVFIRHDRIFTQGWDMWWTTCLKILETLSPSTKKLNFFP
jgi:hypothetical protein